MAKRTPELLRDCLASGNVEAWLAEHPEHRDELLPHLQMHTILRGVRPPEPSAEGERAGHQRLMTAVGRSEGQTRSGRVGWLPAPFMKLATVAAALALFLMAAAGASAALGGPNPADDVLSTLGINNAPEAADNGRGHANPNAFEGADNASEGAANANANAAEGADNASEGAANANANAVEGADNADEGAGNASPNGQAGQFTPPGPPQ